LANSATAAKFKQANIRYALITTVEDYSDQTVEKRRTKDFHYQTGAYNAAGVSRTQANRNSTGHAGAVSAAKVTTQGGIDPEVWMQQTVSLTVRCQLFDVTTGELKKSLTGTFPIQRDITAVARGKNQISTADLCANAARGVADWALKLVDDTVYPLKVVSKTGDEVAISRGTEGGLKVGQNFEVYVEGKELKDPVTGNSLGHNLTAVGWVTITKLEPTFSHARILEDKGIVEGATLMQSKR
jgi:hypothetical protein